VLELTGREEGIWNVVTRDSVHQFNFTDRTVRRIPGPTARPGINDVARPLRQITNGTAVGLIDSDEALGSTASPDVARAPLGGVSRSFERTWLFLRHSCGTPVQRSTTVLLVESHPTPIPLCASRTVKE
jgi:hypothetical protein